jgi:hypothetical protein
MTKPKSWWCIKSGNLLLPFTVRASRRKAISDRLDDIWQEKLPDHESVARIRVEEAPKKKGGRR